jgi:hypothetical protein
VLGLTEAQKWKNIKEQFKNTLILYLKVKDSKWAELHKKEKMENL